MTRLVLVLCISALLGACGFQLKGHSDAGRITLTSLKLSFSEAGSPLEPSLRASIARNNIRLNTGATTAINIGKVTFFKRNLSLESRDETIERELQASVRVSIDNGALLVENFSRSVVYTHDPLAVLSSEREYQLQRQALMQQLSESILLRLENLAPAQ